MRYFALFLMLFSMLVCTVGCGPAADTDTDTPAVDNGTPADDAPAIGDDDAPVAPAAGDDDDAAGEPIPEPPVGDPVE